MTKSKYGILLAISSLPSQYGIGDFGVNAYKFADFTAKRGYKYWQILPLNPIGPGNSPYMSICSEAIEPRYVDLEELLNLGYIDSLEPLNPSANHVDYDAVGNFKLAHLKNAFKGFINNPLEGFDEFKNNNSWIYPFALFSVFRKHFNNLSWIKWPDEYKFYLDNHEPTDIPQEFKDECEFEMFVQFIAYRQWNRLKDYVHKLGLLLIADLPFYVGIDSSDCWMNKQYFLMDENYNPTKVSGCPPDGFSEDGQLWGTPVYDFEKLKEDNYSFLIHRISYIANMCDYLRLDHFRAWDTYCVIPSEDTNARRGEWWIGPREEFFDELFRQYPNMNIIAEDLGILFESVHELRDHYKLPGMFITEFGIYDPNGNGGENTIVYPGTHDNQTVVGWFKTLPENDLPWVKERLGKEENLERAFLEFTWNLPSKITIFSLQDLMGLDDSCRMNSPGTMGSPNWEWKLEDNSYMEKIIFGL